MSRAKIAPAIAEAIEEYAARNIVPVSKQDLISHGLHSKQGYVARNLREEMLVRLAHQCKRLESMGGAPPVSRLVRSHVDTFRDLLESGPVVARIGSGAAQLALPNCPLAQFSAQMNALSERHSNNLEAVMEAQQHDESKQTKEQIDMFLRVNIGIQLLSQHYVSSLKKASKHNSDTSPHQVGVVDTPCIVSLIMEAREQAIQLGQHHLERVPEIHLEGLETATVSCIPAHILHVLFEMLKNSLMATASFHKRHDAVLPPVTVRVSEGLDDVTVSICDQGGGMSRRRVALAYQYLTTSSQLYADQEKEHREIHSYQPATVGWLLPLPDALTDCRGDHLKKA